MEPITVSRETLNDVMEFEHVIHVLEDGSVFDVNRGSRDSWAPKVSMYSVTDTDSIRKPDVSGDGWSLLNGFSGQDSYPGPIMHPSEFVGGKLADHILSTPGYWVVVEVTDRDDPDEPCGWAIAHKEV